MRQVKNERIIEYMSKPYTRVVKTVKDESGSYYVGSILEFDGCMTTGDTVDEVNSLLDDAMEAWIGVKLDNGDAIPVPIDTK